MRPISSARIACLVIFSTWIGIQCDGVGTADKVSEQIEKTINEVYPALVKIEVVVPNFSKGREIKFEAAGSGVIVSPEGYVITNHHVAGRSKAIRCILSSKDELEAILVGTDPLSDIAILKLDLSSRPAGSKPLPVAKFGNSDMLRVGDTVLAMGCPLALSQSVTKGIVANVDMMMPKFLGSDFTLDGEDVGSVVKWIGHDAQIQPGNSGGPLVNLSGQIVGINEIGLGQMSGAIPSKLVEGIMKDIVEHGRVNRSWIGAGFQPLLKSDPGVLAGTPRGILVSSVLEDSPSEKAGLQPGDILTAVDGVPVKVQFREEIPSFNMLLFSKPVGSKIQLEVLRDGKKMNLSLTTELRDSARGQEVESREWGITVEDITTMVSKEMSRKDKKGVLVRSIRPGSPSDKAVPSIMTDDIIVEMDHKSVEDKVSFFNLTQSLLKGKGVPVPTLVMVERQGEKILTIVEIGIRKPVDPIPEAKKAWLPVSTQVLSRKLATAFGIPKARGIRITQIYPDYSSKLDLKVGDILTQMDGRPIEASEQGDDEIFETMTHLYKVGSEVEFTLFRDGEMKKVKAVLMEEPKPEKQLKVYEDNQIEFKARDVSYFDRIRNRWSSEEKGAIVSQVEQGGWADVGGLREGDLIQQIAGNRVHDAGQLEERLKEVYAKKMKWIDMLVRRGIYTFYLEIEPSSVDSMEAEHKQIKNP